VKFDKAADTKASGDITSLSMLVFNADGKLEQSLLHTLNFLVSYFSKLKS